MTQGTIVTVRRFRNGKVADTRRAEVAEVNLDGALLRLLEPSVIGDGVDKFRLRAFFALRDKAGRFKSHLTGWEVCR